MAEAEFGEVPGPESGNAEPLTVPDNVVSTGGDRVPGHLFWEGAAAYLHQARAQVALEPAQDHLLDNTKAEVMETLSESDVIMVAYSPRIESGDQESTLLDAERKERRRSRD